METAQLCQLLHRQHITKDIGNMGKNRRHRLLAEGPVKVRQGIFPAEQFPARHRHPGAQGVKRASDRIVLKAGNHHPVPRMNQGSNGHIQPMGTVHGEHHPLRLTVEHLPSQTPTAEYRLCRLHGRRVAAPARIGASEQSPVDCGAHCLGLVQRGRAVIQVNHGFSSSSPPSSRCR